MNGVARQFWSEILDVKAPVLDSERPHRVIQRMKRVRRTLVRRPPARPAA